SLSVQNNFVWKSLSRSETEDRRSKNRRTLSDSCFEEDIEVPAKFDLTANQSVPRRRCALIDNEVQRSAGDRAGDFFLNELIHAAHPHTGANEFCNLPAQTISRSNDRRARLRLSDQTFIFEF